MRTEDENEGVMRTEDQIEGVMRTEDQNEGVGCSCSFFALNAFNAILYFYVYCCVVDVSNIRTIG